MFDPQTDNITVSLVPSTFRPEPDRKCRLSQKTNSLDLPSFQENTWGTESLRGWLIDWVSQRVSESASAWSSQQVSEWVSGLPQVCVCTSPGGRRCFGRQPGNQRPATRTWKTPESHQEEYQVKRHVSQYPNFMWLWVHWWRVCCQRDFPVKFLLFLLLKRVWNDFKTLHDWFRGVKTWWIPAFHPNLI